MLQIYQQTLAPSWLSSGMWSRFGVETLTATIDDRAVFHESTLYVLPAASIAQHIINERPALVLPRGSSYIEYVFSYTTSPPWFTLV
jgi:hypothetical protein